MKNTPATKLVCIKLPMYPCFYMALGLNDFDGGKSVTRAIGGVGPENLFFGPKWPNNGFSPQNHYVPCHINNRYINSYFLLAGENKWHEKIYQNAAAARTRSLWESLPPSS